MNPSKYPRMMATTWHTRSSTRIGKAGFSSWVSKTWWAVLILINLFSPSRLYFCPLSTQGICTAVLFCAVLWHCSVLSLPYPLHTHLWSCAFLAVHCVCLHFLQELFVLKCSFLLSLRHLWPPSSLIGWCHCFAKLAYTTLKLHLALCKHTIGASAGCWKNTALLVWLPPSTSFLKVWGEISYDCHGHQVISLWTPSIVSRGRWISATFWASRIRILFFFFLVSDSSVPYFSEC